MKTTPTQKTLTEALQKATAALEAERAAGATVDHEIEELKAKAEAAPLGEVAALAERIVLMRTRRETLSRREALASAGEADAARALADAEAEAKRAEIEALEVPIREADAAITAYVTECRDEILRRCSALRILCARANKIDRQPIDRTVPFDDLGRAAHVAAEVRYTRWGDATKEDLLQRGAQLLGEEDPARRGRRLVAAQSAAILQSAQADAARALAAAELRAAGAKADAERDDEKARTNPSRDDASIRALPRGALGAIAAQRQYALR